MINRAQRSLSVAASFAALCLVGAGAQAAECFDRDAAEIKAGNATAVTGPEVGLQRSDADGFMRPRAGADLFTGDRVRTGEASHLQLKLCDWSTYTFSPQSESEISEFYSEDGARRRRVVNFFRGGFRLASGRSTEPGSTEVRIQESGVTMGVRGTSVMLAEVDGVVYAVLEGPVLDNTAYEPRGLVEFWTGDSREAIIASLRRPGWVVSLGPDGVSEPFRAPTDLLRRIYQSFVPVIPEQEGLQTSQQFAGDPEGASGQGTQEGDLGAQFARNDSRREGDDTTSQPDQGCGSTIPVSECQDQTSPPPPPPPPPPPMINVGDILPLDALEDFAAMQQATPDGFVLALMQAELFTDDGTGPVLADQGVAIVQLRIDWANRTIAPEIASSFVKFDFSVTDPNDLSIDNPADIDVPDEIEDAYIEALLTSNQIPFTSGAGGLSTFNTPLYTVVIRQGPSGTVTVDVEADFSDTDNQSVVYNAIASFTDLVLEPGAGDLAYFDFDLASVMSAAEIDSFASSGSSLLSGSSDFVVNTLGPQALLNGIGYAELLVDFDRRTVGGGDSFLALMAPAQTGIGPQTVTQFIALDQPVAFDSGLFNMAFYPLTNLTSDPNALRGQALVADNSILQGAIAAIVNVEDTDRLYTEIELIEELSRGGPIATVANLDAAAGPLGPIDFRFDSNQMGVVTSTFFETAAGDSAIVLASASFDINFANRTVGGGNSFVQADVRLPGAPIGAPPLLNFTETLREVSFAEAFDGLGVFSFDSDDFSGGNVDAALFIIREIDVMSPVNSAGIFFNFNDGAGGAGNVAIPDIPLQQGETFLPPPSVLQ